MSEAVRTQTKAKQRTPRKGRRPKRGSLKNYNWNLINAEREASDGYGGGFPPIGDMLREALLRGLDSILRFCSRR